MAASAVGNRRGWCVIDGVALVLASGYLGLLCFKLAGTAATMRRFAEPAPVLQADALTVLTPVLGGDPDLPAALDYNVRNLTGVRWLWLVDEDDAEGQRATDAVRRAHPQASIEIVRCPAAPACTNPKTFKLDRALARVQTPMFLVLDDDARLTRESLAHMAAELRSADLVTGLPCYRDTGATPDRLLAQFVNNNAALTYLALLPWRAPVSINGMCYLMHTAQFRELGGFGPLLRHLADDLAVATRLIEARARLVQSTAAVELRTSVNTWRRYVQQMHRWFLFATLLVRVQSPATNLLIVGLYGLHPLLLAGLIARGVLAPGPATLGLLLLTLLVRSAGLAWVQRRLTGRVRQHPLLSLLSELLQPLHLAHGALVRRIQWRSRRYRVRANDDFAPF